MVSKKEYRDFAILGMGKVGTAIGFLLRRAGYEIRAVSSRSLDSAMRASKLTGGRVCRSLSEAASAATCVIIATTDDAIEPVCREIVEEGSITAGKNVIHLSGAGGLDLLSAARARGARVATIHPIQTLADVNLAISRLPGSTFGITAEKEIEAWSAQLVRDLGGIPLMIPEADRPLYHAAACIASNYLVALMHMAEELYTVLGLPPEGALQAFWPLVQGTIQNIELNGVVKSLTGPIARGDIGTVERHLEALRQLHPRFSALYRLLGSEAVEIGIKKWTLSETTAQAIRTLLQEGDLYEQGRKHQ